MSDKVTEMSHAQAGMMLDLVLSQDGIHADLDAKALINLAEAAEVLGRSEDAARLLANIDTTDITATWEGLTQASILLRRDPEIGLNTLAELVAEIRSGDDHPLLAGALNLLSQAQAMTDDLDSALETQYESLAIKTSLGSLVGQSNAHHNLLQFTKQSDDLESALTHAKRIVELVRESGDREWEMSALADLAHLLACDEQFDLSEDNYRLSLDLAEEHEDMTAAVIGHWGIADLAMLRGDGQMAMEHYSQALASQIQTGQPAPPELLQRIAALTGDEGQ
jgi:tetratricopeptide (TPR) repeat protein